MSMSIFIIHTANSPVKRTARRDGRSGPGTNSAPRAHVNRPPPQERPTQFPRGPSHSARATLNHHSVRLRTVADERRPLACASSTLVRRATRADVAACDIVTDLDGEHRQTSI